jgi:gas vesicle protein
MADNDSGWSFATGFFIGSVVGAIAGILLAPKPGAQTRTELVEQSEAWRTRAEEMAAMVRERVGPTVEGVRERMGPTVENVRERVAPAVETVRERVGPVADAVSARVGRSGSEADGGPGAEAVADAEAEERKDA